MAAGKKTGGRKKGAKNKKPSQAVIAAKLAEHAAAAGVMPLEYMLQVLRDGAADPILRFDAAKSAAPYCHARLASIDHTTKGKAIPATVIING